MRKHRETAPAQTIRIEQGPVQLTQAPPKSDDTLQDVIMQTLINVLALSSFAVSAAVVGGGTYVYLNKDAMIEDAKEKAAAATEAIAGALPGMPDAMPTMPVQRVVLFPWENLVLQFLSYHEFQRYSKNLLNGLC